MTTGPTSVLENIPDGDLFKFKRYCMYCLTSLFVKEYQYMNNIYAYCYFCNVKCWFDSHYLVQIVDTIWI